MINIYSDNEKVKIVKENSYDVEELIIYTRETEKTIKMITEIFMKGGDN